MYAPSNQPGLQIDRLLEDKLVLVMSKGAQPADCCDYVHVDWGPHFVPHQDDNLFEGAPRLLVNLGPLALSYILARGGSGYFRMRAILPHLASGQLQLVAGAPEYSYPIYVAYSADADRTVLQPALDGLRQISAQQTAPPKRRS
jgi:hypothetical protein